MLQQTQIVTALPYYQRWMDRFPTVEALAAADEQEALAFWQGLGYYRRCRMLHSAARQVVENGMPTNFEEWLKVPGVGRYTAAAIASICYEEPQAVVDGNVERVYSRVTCDPATGSNLKNRTWVWADQHLYHPEPGEWNQAVMELGATVCKPVQPQCERCPISKECEAYQTDRTNEFPSPKQKPSTVRYEEEIYILVCGDQIGYQPSHDLAWWKGMSLLPISSTYQLDQEGVWKEGLGQIRYVVTHHRITALVSLIRIESPLDDLSWASKEELDGVPIPAPHRKALALYHKT